MAGPDLTRATAKVASLMDDAVQIRRDRAGSGDDELDEATGELIPADGGAALWSGPALVTAEAHRDAAPEPDATDPVMADTDRRYRALLPLSAPPVEAGDVLTVTASRRDPQIVGARFRITAPGQVGTYVVARAVGMVRL